MGDVTMRYGDFVSVAEGKTPAECGSEAITFGSETYHLVGDDDFQEWERGVVKCFAYAIADDAECEDGKYPCVSVEFKVADGKRGEAVGVEETETVYDVETGEIEEEDLF